MALITGTDNADTLLGTELDDTIIGGPGYDILDGVGGFNMAVYWTSPFGIVVRLFANTVDNDGFGGRDTLIRIEGIAGSGHDDLIWGNDLGNYIQGFTGNDTVYGLGGDDIIRVGEGDDSVDGGEGTDRLFFLGNRADYTVTPIAGGFIIADNVPGRYGTDTVLNVELFQFSDTQLTAAEIADPNAPGDGQPYPPAAPAQPSLGDLVSETAPRTPAAIVSGDAGDNTLFGAGTNDLLSGLAGADVLSAGAGEDTLVGGAGSDLLDGGEGLDIVDYGAEAAQGGTLGVSVDLLTLTGTAIARDAFGAFDALRGIEGAIGTGLADMLYGSNGVDIFAGRGGDDQIVLWDGNDFADGGAGNDVILGWTGEDTLLGGSGDDWLWTGAGSDRAEGGLGADVLVGDLPGSAEAGDDLLIGGLGADILLGGVGADTLFGGLDATPGSDAGARDWLVGGAGSDLMSGGSGDDVIWEELDSSQGGNDTALGGDGNDLILTGDGADSIDGGTGNDTLYGGAGADTIATGAGADDIWIRDAGEFGDVITDFAPGADRLILYSALGGSTAAQAFAQARLTLVATGTATELRYDADGAGADPSVLVATFLGLQPAGFNTATDFL